MGASRHPSTARRPARAHPRTVLLWVFALVVVCAALYAAAPWILPVRVIEGPVVQLATEDAVTLVWYTTRPAECAVTVTVGSEERTQAGLAAGRRNQVRVSGLAPGTAYSYRVSVAGRRLTDELVFQTNRTADQRFTFIVFGDSGKGSRAQYELAADMIRAEPAADFVVHTGDLVYHDGARRRYGERFFTPYRHLLARVNFWPCLGNHDIDTDGTAAAYQEVFELPQNGPANMRADHDYWFDYASCRVAVVDSNVTEDALRERVAPWLHEVMADPRPRWRFVAFHHPPYTGGKYPPDERIQRTLVPVFEEVGVDLVFSGHDHNYQRSYPLRGGQVVASEEGVIYVVSGAGGAQLYDARLADQRADYVAVLEDQRYSFTQVTIAGDELKLRQIARGGDIIDEFTLRKSPGRDETPGPTTAPTTAPTTRDGDTDRNTDVEMP